MRKFLIEGSCDGAMFAETVEAQTMEDAEAFAIERLCEAWGETYGPDTELSDLGDAACVTEYTADDYARDAAPEMVATLEFILPYLRELDRAEKHRNRRNPTHTPNAEICINNVRNVLAKARGEA